MLEVSVWTEVSDFGSKGRFGIPAAARRRITWFDEAVEGGLLATLESEGVCRLEPWTDIGDVILNEVTMAMEANPEKRSDIVLAAMDRYLHVSVEGSGRVVMPSNLVAHLDPSGTGRARAVVKDNQLWLWSEAQWQMERADRMSLLLGSSA